MTELLPCVEVGPTDAQTSVVWMHGLGANGHDFEPLVPMLGLPETRFVFPHAPSMPVTINGGFVMPAWYDIESLELTADRGNADHVRASARRIVDLVQREHARGVPAERMVIAGFSQGAAMALHVGLRYPETLAGIMVLSGYLVDGGTVDSESTDANQLTPILQCHGEFDPVLPLQFGELTRDKVQSLSPERPHEWHTYPMEHAVCPQEIALIAEWLKQRLGAGG